MSELFLTSSVHAVAHDIAKQVDLATANKLVFIDTAAEPKGERDDLEWLKNDRQALVDSGFVVTDYTITGKSPNQLGIDLKEFDYIYISGGDTTYLLEQSQKSGFISFVKELIEKKGKIYIGTSAGSIIAGPQIPDYLTDETGLKDVKGYNFVNFTVIPHWNSEHFKERYLGERLKIAYEKYKIPLILLNDNQYIHVKDGSFKIVDVTRV